MSQFLKKPFAYRIDKATTQELRNEITSWGSPLPEKVVACECGINYGLVMIQGTTESDQVKYVNWLEAEVKENCPDHPDKIRPSD